MIGFNVPIFMEESIESIKEAASKRKICGDGEFTKEKINSHKIIDSSTRYGYYILSF